ncbi:IS66 family insertion sequence element accessory protein TnpA [Azospirillum sp. sgz302134]
MGSTVAGSAESFWRGHVEAWRASGRSRSDYCAAQGLSRKTFGWWAWGTVNSLAPTMMAGAVRPRMPRDRGIKRPAAHQRPQPRQ